jgi:hypothetical protein
MSLITKYFDKRDKELKMTIFWVVAPRSLVDFTDVSEVLAPSSR